MVTSLTVTENMTVKAEGEDIVLDFGGDNELVMHNDLAWALCTAMMRVIGDMPEPDDIGQCAGTA